MQKGSSLAVKTISAQELDFHIKNENVRNDLCFLFLGTICTTDEDPFNNVKCANLAYAVLFFSGKCSLKQRKSVEMGQFGMLTNPRGSEVLHLGLSQFT